MKKQILSQLGLAVGLAALMLAVMVPFGQAQDYHDHYDHDRGQFDANHAGARIIQRTIADLHSAQQRRGQTEKAYDRYSNAVRHLNEFSAKFSRGNFDKDKLDTAIDDVKNVADNNALAPGDRQMLERDLEDLRNFRASHHD